MNNRSLQLPTAHAELDDLDVGTTAVLPRRQMDVCCTLSISRICFHSIFAVVSATGDADGAGGAADLRWFLCSLVCCNTFNGVCIGLDKASCSSDVTVLSALSAPTPLSLLQPSLLLHCRLA